MEIGAATVENLHSMKVSQKTNNRITLRYSSSTTKYILKKKKPKILIQKYVYSNICSRIIYNCQGMEATCVINR